MRLRLIGVILFGISGAAYAALPPVVNGYEQKAIAAQPPSAIVGLYKKVQQLQQEVQQLRGLVEEQSYLIESLQKRQRDLYLDTDKRLQVFEQLGKLTAEPVQQKPLANKGSVDSKLKVVAGQDKQAYSQAFASLKAANYAEAIIAFSNFEKNYPNSQYLVNSLYWLGEASYVSRDFKRAELEFKKVVADFPLHSKAKDAKLKIAFIEYENKQWKQARLSLQSLVEHYPGSTVAQLAQKRLDRMAQEKL